jgi:hypothetical protein
MSNTSDNPDLVAGEAWRSSGSFASDQPLQIVWDSTSLGLFKECPRKYYYTMVEGWSSKRTSTHLVFGIHYHAALEAYDKAKYLESMSHDEAQLAAVRYCFHEAHGPLAQSDLPAKTFRTLVRSVVWYLEQFADDPATTIQLANDRPAVELSFKFDPQVRPGFLLSGHIDRLVEMSGNVWVMDRKTTSGALTQGYFAQFRPDNQMSLYNIAGQMVYNAPSRGVIIDAAQVQVHSTRFMRGMAHRTPAEDEEFLGSLGFWWAQAEHMAEEYPRRGPAAFPMNEKSCGSYGGCVFRQICGKSPSIRKDFLHADFQQHQWDPTVER